MFQIGFLFGDATIESLEGIGGYGGMSGKLPFIPIPGLGLDYIFSADGHHGFEINVPIVSTTIIPFESHAGVTKGWVLNEAGDYIMEMALYRTETLGESRGLLTVWGLMVDSTH